MSVTEPEQRIFLRKASGLVRSASAFDTFIFNIGLISVGIGVGLLMYYGAAYYPNANLWLGSLFACAVMAVIALGMLTWTITLPRSGGIYVFGSRSLPPWLALTLSMVEITAWQAMCAAAAYWIITLGIGPALAMIGYVSHSPGFIAASKWVTSPWQLFVIGSLILTLSYWICIGGMKRFLLSQKIAFALAIGGSILMIVMFALGSHQQFVEHFNSVMAPYMHTSHSYEAIVASAQKEGWANTTTPAWLNTIKVSNWAFLPLIGAAFSIAIAGEIKSVSRSQTFGMLGSIAITAVLWVLTIFLANAVIGHTFLGASVYNKLQGVGVSTPTDPAVSLLAGVLYGSPVLTALTSVGLIAWMWLWIPGMHTFAVRAMAAWAFDRVAPEPLGQVSETRHTPVFGYTVSWLFTVLCMYLLVFTPIFSAVIVFIMMAIGAWSIILLAGTWFPYQRPEMYAKSPIAGMRILGIPVMSIACGAGFLAAQFYFWNLFFDPVAAGHGAVQMATVGVVFLFGIVFYFVMAFYRKSQGVDVRLAFKEIPIE